MAMTMEIATLRKYVDDRDEHKQSNALQAVGNLSYLMEERNKLLEERNRNFMEFRKEQDQRHESNSSKISGINARISYAMGAAAVVIILLQHYWK